VPFVSDPVFAPFTLGVDEKHMNLVNWKIIFNIWGVIFVLTIISNLSEGTIDIFNTVILAIGLTGLYGLAYEKAIWSQRFWKIFFIALLALTGIIFVMVGLSVVVDLSSPSEEVQSSGISVWQVLIGGIYLVFYFLQIYGLYSLLSHKHGIKKA
jgi:hypothetical protein